MTNICISLIFNRTEKRPVQCKERPSPPFVFIHPQLSRFFTTTKVQPMLHRALRDVCQNQTAHVAKNPQSPQPPLDPNEQHGLPTRRGHRPACAVRGAGFRAQGSLGASGFRGFSRLGMHRPMAHAPDDLIPKSSGGRATVKTPTRQEGH